MLVDNGNTNKKVYHFIIQPHVISHIKLMKFCRKTPLSKCLFTSKVLPKRFIKLRLNRSRKKTFFDVNQNRRNTLN